MLHFYKNTELALNLIKYENSVCPHASLSAWVGCFIYIRLSNLTFRH